MPIAVVVDGANRHDMKLVERTLEAIMISAPIPPRTSPRICAWTKDTTILKYESWWQRGAIPATSGAEEKNG